MEKGEIEEIKRHFGVVADGLRNEIRQVAEGHEVIRNEIQTLREESEQAHREILSAIKFSYAELDRGAPRAEPVTPDSTPVWAES